MSEISKGALTSENNSSFPNNNTGYITPTILRTFNQNMIDSLVDEISYTADSASVNTKITNLQSWSSSLDATYATDAQLSASVAALSASVAVTDLAQSASIGQLLGFSSSLDATFATDAQLTALSTSVAVTDAEQDSKINSLTNATSSYAISSSVASITAQSIVTASVSNNTITFTKGNGSTFGLTVATGSGGSVPSGTVSSSAQIAAFGYATTGSNTFIGDEQIVGVIQASDTNVGPQWFGPVKFQAVGNTSTGVAYDQFVNGGNYDALHIESQLNAGTIFQDTNGSTLQTWMQIPANSGANPAPQFKRGLGVTGSVNVSNGDILNIGSGTTINPLLYLTESVTGHANIIKGWGENPAAGGAGSSQANYTGSLRITGSNNTVALPQIRATAIGGGVDSQGYISGSDNIIAGNQAGIFLNTGSQLFPKTNNNQIANQSSIVMNFTTSSLSGGHPIVQANIINGGALTFNSNSGSITAASANIINAGGLTSTQNFVTNTRPVISSNILTGNNVTVNHISSSVTFQSNIANSGLTINNHLSSSGLTNNGLTFTNNAVLGGSSNTPLGVWVSGSQASNANRTIIDNLIGGKSIIVSSSFVSSSNSSLVGSLIYGQNLVVNGNNSTTSGGSTFVGRFNDSGSLANSQDIVFAVGTGIGAATRRTGLWIDSGSNTTISGSLSSKGNAAFTGSVDVTGSTLSLNNSGGVALKIFSGSFELTSPQGTGYFYTNLPITSSNLRINGPGIISDLFVSGVFSGNSTLNVSGNSYFTGSVNINNATNITGSLYIQSGSGDLFMYGHKMFSVGGFQTNVTQSGSANVSQSVNFEVTDVSYGVSVVSNSRLTVGNAGVYSITFSAQLKADSGADTVYTWLKKNGSNVAESATKQVLANNSEAVQTVNFMVEAAANDYFEIAWQSSNGDAVLYAENASGNIPSIPSVIVTVTQVR